MKGGRMIKKEGEKRSRVVRNQTKTEMGALKGKVVHNKKKVQQRGKCLKSHKNVKTFI